MFGENHKGESRLERLFFSIVIVLKMLIPPILSLKRMEVACRKWIAKNPTAYTPRAFLADVYRFHGKTQEARREYEELFVLGSISNRDKLRFAEVLFKLGDFRRVIEISEPIIAAYPRHINANWYLAMSFMETRNYAQAAKYFKNSISAGNRRYKDYWRLGFCLARAVRFMEACEAYKAGLALKPDCAELRENIRCVQSRLEEGSDMQDNLGRLHDTNDRPPPN
jgi:tetratricopeptide (TPR) repeat protein